MTGSTQIKAFSLKSTDHCILILYGMIMPFNNLCRVSAGNVGRSNGSKYGTVNGTKVISNAPFTATGDWGAWGEKMVSVPMNQGINTLKLITTGTEGPNIDRI
ncbi:hypothetical protein [Paenibacillus sp. JJ-223]|uniref:hypothetical protein n=1 Tax=Paenibacillus sp. JJ-223 TaxID=2905647 RepID=UPI001F32FDEF|nr:hypothetical protein [Paenibacillus sp. JJ-223]CAH1199416.1 hypothetical protein PAECIP111890_01601 [Paenibacillus sp. JJ-223]